jgi:hypothetical protein
MQEFLKFFSTKAEKFRVESFMRLLASPRPLSLSLFAGPHFQAGFAPAPPARGRRRPSREGLPSRSAVSG